MDLMQKKDLDLFQMMMAETMFSYISQQLSAMDSKH